MKISIRTKIIGCIFAGIFSVAVGAILLVRNAVSKGFTEEMLKMGSIATQHVAEQLATPVLTNDIPRINLIIYRLKQEQDSIEYSFLTGPEGQVLASTLKEGAALEVAKLNPIPPAAEHSTRHFHAQRTGIYDVAYKLLKSDLGELHIGFSDKIMEAAINEFNRRFLLIIFLICSIGFGLAIYVAGYIITPVEKLAQKMRQVRQGNLDVSIDKLPNDEIGLLGQTFNQMIGDLRDYAQSMEEKNTQLIEAQDQLVCSERLAAIGQLASSVGHELRNPLGGMKNALYYVKDKVLHSPLAQDNPRTVEFLGMIDDEINNSNKIISDLLEFSRTRKPTVSPTQINEVIEDTLKRLELNSNIKLIKELDSHLLPVPVDGNQMRQVFINLIQNAQAAMAEGGELRVRTGEQNGHVQIDFSDTGSGIPPEIIKKIFSPLFTTKSTGIGLGLAVCQGIVERHGGKIEVESEVGQGTTFRVRLAVNR